MTTRCRSSFKKGDVKKAVAAVAAATGAPIQRVEIDPQTGKVVVTVGTPGETPGTNNEWDEVLDRDQH
jgi:hypothetical protein